MKTILPFLCKVGFIYYLVTKLLDKYFSIESSPYMFPTLSPDVSGRLSSAIGIFVLVASNYPAGYLMTIPEYFALVARRVEFEIAKMRGTLDDNTALRYVQAVDDLLIELDLLSYKMPPTADENGDETVPEE